tara:strand:- start:57 stop:401 length:345 start_codon:yes stop_codon:yes gene_type:complete
MKNKDEFETDWGLLFNMIGGITILTVLLMLFLASAFAQTDLVILESHKELLELKYNVHNNDINFLESNLQKERQKLQETTCELVEVKQELGLEIKNPSNAMRLCPKIFIQTTPE